MIDDWLQHIKDVNNEHTVDLNLLEDEEHLERLCEPNVIRQVTNVTQTAVVQKAREEVVDLSVHGWIYNISDGIIKDLNTTQSGN